MKRWFKKVRLTMLVIWPIKKNERAINQFIVNLKKLDQSMLSSTIILKNKLKLSLNESSRLIINSPAWRESKAKTIKMNKIFIEELEKLARK